MIFFCIISAVGVMPLRFAVTYMAMKVQVHNSWRRLLVDELIETSDINKEAEQYVESKEFKEKYGRDTSEAFRKRFIYKQVSLKT